MLAYSSKRVRELRDRSAAKPPCLVSRRSQQQRLARRWRRLKLGAVPSWSRPRPVCPVRPVVRRRRPLIPLGTGDLRGVQAQAVVSVGRKLEKEALAGGAGGEPWKAISQEEEIPDEQATQA